MRKVLIWSLRVAGALFLAVFLAAALFAGRVYWQAAGGLPDHRLADGATSWHGCIPPGAKQDFVPLGAMPAHAVNAFLAAEDPEFFTRKAFNPLTEIARRIWGMKPHGSPRVSEYYVRELFHCHSASMSPAGWHGKFALLLYRLERGVPRRNILETVINSAYFGNGAYGMPAAAQRYLHKPLTELSTGELAFLASLSKGASLFAPGTYANMPLKRRNAVLDDLAVKRRNFILDRMVRMGALTAEQASPAKLEPLNLQL